MSNELMDFLLEVPKPGEYELKLFLREKGIKVKDVSDDGIYQAKDIDLLCWPPSAQPYSVEVKWDNRIADTQNLFWEIESYNKAGWGRYCEADYLFYGDAQNSIFYIFRVDLLRKYIEQNKANFRTQRAFDFSKKDNTLRGESIGLIVPLSEVSHLYSTIAV